MVHPEVHLWSQAISKKLHKPPNDLAVMLTARGKEH